MRILISVLLTAALISLVNPPAAQINNSDDRTKTQVVQAEAPRKEPTLPEQEKALTEQQVVPKPEPVAEAKEQVKPPEPKPLTQGCETYRSLVSKYDWDANVALAVMQAESGCNPSGPPSSTCDRGLMQINCVHADMVNNLDDLYDPATNISVAYKVYLGRKQKTGNGWQAWNAYKSGKHLRFL